jgi:ADP-heptose:LPS heptosyltransferase
VAQPPRILILQLKRIGDTILTAPAVAALRARHPEAEIVMVVPESVAELVACFTGVSRVLAYHPMSLNLRGLGVHCAG